MSGTDAGDGGKATRRENAPAEGIGRARKPGSTPPSGGAASDGAILRNLVARSPHASALVEGPSHVLRAMSPSFCSLLEVEQADVVNRPWASALPGPPDAELVSLLDRVYHSGAAERDHELPHRSPSGASAVWGCTVWPYEDRSGATAGLMVELRDRTPEKEETRRLREMTDQIRQINERLLHSALREQEWAEKAEAAARAKADFLSMMSHELRTPLNGIVGYTEVLREEVLGPMNAKQREGLQRISNCSANLLQMIEDVLGYARVEAHSVPMRLERVELCRLARETAALVEPLAMKKGLELFVEAPDEPLSLETDPQMVRQILLNLLGNAVKFTERGSVRLKVGPEGEGIGLRVHDTGMGIALEDLERIFEPFVQSEGVTTRRFGGTGLGLPISRALATALGGALKVESTPGMGATFSVYLPRTPPPASAATFSTPFPVRAERA